MQFMFTFDTLSSTMTPKRVILTSPKTFQKWKQMLRQAAIEIAVHSDMYKSSILHPALSGPAISCLAVWSAIFICCISVPPLILQSHHRHCSAYTSVYHTQKPPIQQDKQGYAGILQSSRMACVYTLIAA